MLKTEGNANPGATIEEAQILKKAPDIIRGNFRELWKFLDCGMIYSLLLKETTKIINLFIINIRFF